MTHYMCLVQGAFKLVTSDENKVRITIYEGFILLTVRQSGSLICYFNEEV